MSMKSIPAPVRREGRSAFGLSYFTSEADADAYAQHVREQGLTYNGGFFHGMPCGREPGRDSIDQTTGAKLYAVTD